MKNKIVKGALLASIAFLAIACNQKKEETTTAVAIDTAQIKTEIQAIEDAFSAAYSSGNSDAVTYYADDATSFINGKMPLVGKDAIHQFIKEDVATFPKGSKIAFTTNEVHVSSDGNQVVEIGAYKVVDSTDTKTNSGNFISLFEKRDGKYICVRDIANSDMPKPEK